LATSRRRTRRWMTTETELWCVKVSAAISFTEAFG
jgi:hypothetical protein